MKHALRAFLVLVVEQFALRLWPKCTIALVFVGLTAGLPLISHGTPAWSGVVNTDPKSGVSIEISSPFSEAPPSGTMPFQIKISNHSGGARTYDFQLSSGGLYPRNGEQMSVHQSVRVENGAETRMPVIVPMGSSSGEVARYSPIVIGASGYGVDTPQTYMTSKFRGGTGIPSRTVFVGMSERLHTRSWEPWEKYFSGHGETLIGSSVDLTLLPPDWRGLTGMECLWLTPEDYAGLDAERQTAIQDWVSRGGALYVCETTPNQLTRTEFGLRDARARAVPFGFGEVHWFDYEDGKELSAAPAKVEIDHLAERQAGLAEFAETWRMETTVGALKLNAPVLLVLIGLFAVLIGPVNLFYFARSDRRHRLFWTTPAISLGATLLLILFIVAQDGFGGHGERVAVTLLLPERNKAVTVQEQLARTGVLLSREFLLGSDALITPVGFRASDNRQLVQSGSAYSGDWFASRSLQAQRLESIQPSRARVQLLNAEQFSTGAPPVVISSLPVELKEILVRDAGGRWWQGRDLRTGEQQTLRAGNPPGDLSGPPGRKHVPRTPSPNRAGPAAFFREHVEHAVVLRAR